MLGDGSMERSLAETRSTGRARRRRLRITVVVMVLLAMVGGVVAATTATGQEAAAEEVRIVARKHVDGRIEFGLRQRLADGTWGEVLLPRARFFPTTAPVGSWLASTPLTLAPLAESQPVVPHEDAARAFLSAELGFVSAVAFPLLLAERVDWPDAALGCGEGFAATVITPGYRLVFEVDGVSYEVRTNLDGSLMVLC